MRNSPPNDHQACPPKLGLRLLLDDRDPLAGGDELGCGDQPGESCPDDDGAHPSSLMRCHSVASRACRELSRTWHFVGSYAGVTGPRSSSGCIRNGMSSLIDSERLRALDAGARQILAVHAEQILGVDADHDEQQVGWAAQAMRLDDLGDVRQFRTTAASFRCCRWMLMNAVSEYPSGTGLIRRSSGSNACAASSRAIRACAVFRDNSSLSANATTVLRGSSVKAMSIRVGRIQMRHNAEISSMSAAFGCACC